MILLSIVLICSLVGHGSIESVPCKVHLNVSHVERYLVHNVLYVAHYLMNISWVTIRMRNKSIATAEISSEGRVLLVMRTLLRRSIAF